MDVIDKRATRSSLSTSDLRLPTSIDWDGWEEERRRYGSYKEPINHKGRSRRYLTSDGVTLTPKQWCEALELAMAPQTLWHRVVMLGWSFEKAISTPLHHAPITYKGKTQGLVAWSHDLGISNSTLQYRLQIMKLSVEEAFAPAKNYQCKRFVTYMGETRTFSEWSKILGFGGRTLYNRIHTIGWDVEKAFTTPLRGGKSKKKS